MPFNGIVRGICISGSGARTAGTATFQVFRNGSYIGGGASDAVIGATSTQFVCSSTGAAVVNAGDILDVRVTTTVAWLPVNLYFTAQIVYEFTN